MHPSFPKGSRRQGDPDLPPRKPDLPVPAQPEDPEIDPQPDVTPDPVGIPAQDPRPPRPGEVVPPVRA